MESPLLFSSSSSSSLSSSSPSSSSSWCARTRLLVVAAVAAVAAAGVPSQHRIAAFAPTHCRHRRTALASSPAPSRRWVTASAEGGTAGGDDGQEEEEEEDSANGSGSPGLEAAFYEAIQDSSVVKDGDDEKALPKFDEKETEQMTREFFDVVQKRLEDSPASDKKIWDALSSRAGFARVSLMLKEALENRKEAKKVIQKAMQDVSNLNQAEGGGFSSDGDAAINALAMGGQNKGSLGSQGGLVTDSSDEGSMLGSSSEVVVGGDSFEASLMELKLSMDPGREEMTPTDVIDAVLAALKENDSPEPNNGINVLLSYMSDASSFGEVTDASLFEEYIPSGAYSVLVNWEMMDFPKKLDLSLDGSRAYQVVRLRDKRLNEWKKVKWTLSKRDDVWYIDNVLVMTSRR